MFLLFTYMFVLKGCETMENILSLTSNSLRHVYIKKSFK